MHILAMVGAAAVDGAAAEEESRYDLAMSSTT